MRVLWISWLALFGAAFIDVWAPLDPPPGADEVDVRAAANFVEARRPSEDVLVHSPLLGAAARRGLGSLSASPDHPRQDSGPAWIIDHRVAPMGGLNAPERWRSGDVIVRRMEGAMGEDAGPVRSDLLHSIRPDTMRLQHGVRTIACRRPRPDGGYGCPGAPDWVHVGPAQFRVAGQSVRCVWAHPQTGRVVRLRLPPPPSGTVALVVRAALDDGAVTGTPDGAAVRTVVKQGFETLAVLRVPNQKGWVRRRIPFSSRGRAEAVELEVTSVRDGRRHHCVDVRWESDASPSD